ncbi:disulfide bond formation protein B [Chitiniphilus eburneus]|uniref:Disulfide bond formation protein B n=1 Tax=Chitiniphilus eburneus TaxID=2571148 RepID=A0A4U0Q694_9NEIS|nr:disulfide bond formation protein B [Chitiniphilus eburneus]TJZ76300.1 disulfide bond formation protein B [Chitiniphilus eburneus]
MARWRLWFLVLFLACCGMVGFAMYHQIYNWVMPCLMCIYQRLAVIAFGLLSLLAVFWKPASRRGVIILGSLLGLSALAGAASAVWNLRLQYGTPDPNLACASSLPFPIDLNDPGWPGWLVALIRPVGSCTSVDFTLLGLSMPLLVLFTMLVLLGLTFALSARRWRELKRKFWV